MSVRLGAQFVKEGWVVVNKLEPSARCRVCGLDIRAQWNVTTLARMRVEWSRMMANGMDDRCQVARFEAAVEYENAMAELRLVMDLGASWTRKRPPSQHPALRLARWRLQEATRRCEELKMWPADRPVREETK